MDGLYRGPNPALHAVVTRGDEKLGDHQFYNQIILGQINNVGQVSFTTISPEVLLVDGKPLNERKVWRADPVETEYRDEDSDDGDAPNDHTVPDPTVSEPADWQDPIPEPDPFPGIGPVVQPDPAVSNPVVTIDPVISIEPVTSPDPITPIFSRGG